MIAHFAEKQNDTLCGKIHLFFCNKCKRELKKNAGFFTAFLKGIGKKDAERTN